ncbi:MAG: formate dehydrogenase accessory sulfurtransferase FdhD [Pseudomonadota bacterium]
MKVLVAAPLARWRTGQGEARDEDLVATEVPVALTVNRRSHVVMMATPMDLEAFALGFGLTEGLLQDRDELLAVRVIPRDAGLELAMTVSEAAAERVAGQRRNLTGRTGCGLCGAESLQQAVRYPAAVGDHLRITHEALQRAVEALSSHQPLQAAAGAVHCAAWCDDQGEIGLAREDVGRHNALDKLVGALAMAGEDASRGFFLVSSRASYEMVLKTAFSGVELLAAVSAPTSLAIELAGESGLSLVGFARPGRHNAYTGRHRICGSEETA